MMVDIWDVFCGALGVSHTIKTAPLYFCTQHQQTIDSDINLEAYISLHHSSDYVYLKPLELELRFGGGGCSHIYHSLCGEKEIGGIFSCPVAWVAFELEYLLLVIAFLDLEF